MFYRLQDISSKFIFIVVIGFSLCHHVHVRHSQLFVWSKSYRFRLSSQLPEANLGKRSLRRKTNSTHSWRYSSQYPQTLANMIIDGFISYPLLESPFFRWHPSNDLLHALLLATFSTILSYQVTALIFDFFLGYKKIGKVSITDLITLRLAEDSNPFAIAANLSPNHAFSEWQMHGIRKTCPRQKHSRKPVRPCVLAKFLTLLIIAPLVNLITVILNLERDTDITFKQAHFGGIALGLNTTQNRKVNTGLKVGACQMQETKLHVKEVPMTDFFLCTRATSNNKARVEPGYGNLTLSRNRKQVDGLAFESITADAVIGLGLAHYYTQADLHSGGKPYRLRIAVDIEQGRQMFERGRAHLMKNCNCTRLGETIETRHAPSHGWSISLPLQCEICPRNLELQSLFEMSKGLTLVDSERFEIAQIPTEHSKRSQKLTFFSGDELIFLRRRRGFASLPTLFALVGGVLVMRMVARLFVHNDVHIAVELLVKSRLGVPCCDSMLQRAEKLKFGPQITDWRDAVVGTDACSDIENDGWKDPKDLWKEPESTGDGAASSDTSGVIEAKYG